MFSVSADDIFVCLEVFVRMWHNSLCDSDIKIVGAHYLKKKKHTHTQNTSFHLWMDNNEQWQLPDQQGNKDMKWRENVHPHIHTYALGGCAAALKCH